MTARSAPLLAALGRPLADAPDADLLRRYAADRDEGAFAELVRRYGKLVWRAARTTAGGGAAEDVFQATFLALARSAGSVRRPDALAGWLHRTARRAGLKARRRVVSVPPPRPPADDPLDRLTARELLLAVDEEIAALPDALRTPLLLCAVEGLSQDETARRLGWSAGSVKGRLERARAKLRQRLEARGLVVPAVLLAAAAVPPGLGAAVLDVARGGAVPPAVTALVTEVTRMSPSFWWKPVAALAVVVGGITVLAGGGGTDPEPTPAARAAGPQPTPPAKLVLWSVPLRADGDGPEAPFTAGAWAPDGKHVLTAGSAVPEKGKPRAGEVRVWDADTGKVVRTFRGAAATYGSMTGGLAVSPDGKSVAAGGEAWTERREVNFFVEVWDWGQGKPRLKLDADPQLPPGQQNPAPKRFKAPVSGVAFSPDGRTLVGTSDGGQVTGWDVDPASKTVGNRLFESWLRPRTRGAVFHPTAGAVAVAEEGGVAFLDGKTGQPRGGFSGEGWFVSVAFAPDGKTLATGGRIGPDGAPVVLHSVTAEKTGDLTVGAGRAGKWAPPIVVPLNLVVHQVAFSPDGKLVAAACQDNTVRVFDAETSRAVAFAEEHKEPVFAAQFSPDGRRLLTVGRDAVKVWSVPALLKQKPADPKPATPPKQVRWSAPLRENVDDPDAPAATAGAWAPDGKHVLTAGSAVPEKGKPRAGEVRVWDADTGKVVHTFRGVATTYYGDRAGGLAVSPDGKTVAAGGVIVLGENKREYLVEVWDWGADKPRLTLGNEPPLPPGEGDEKAKGDDKPRLQWGPDRLTFFVSGVAFAPGGKSLVAVTTDGVVKGWDVAVGSRTAGKRLFETRLRQNRCWGLAVHPTAPTVAVADDDGWVAFLDAKTGRPRGGFRGKAGFLSAAFAPDGKALAVGGHENPPDTVRIAVHPVTADPAGDLTAGAGRVVKGGPDDGVVYQVAYSPDGKLLAAACQDKTVRLFNVDSGKPVGVAKEHTDFVYTAQFSPDGKRLLTVGRDSVKVWTVAELLKRKPD